MAIENTVSAEDMMSVTPKAKGDLEKDTGPLSFQQQRKRAAQTAMAQHGVPKRWKGRGDYFFEMQEDGKLKITGGDKAKSLTGGKSVVISDRDKISEIIEKARGGDIVESGVSYTEQVRDMSPEELSAVPQRIEFDTKDYTPGGGIDVIGESEAVETMQERLGQSGMEREEREAQARLGESTSSADSPVVVKLKQAKSGLLGMIENAENEQLAKAYRAALAQVEENLKKALGD